MQFQADILGVTVQRPKVAETTALGPLTGWSAGCFWQSEPKLPSSGQSIRTFEPQMSKAQRDVLYAVGNRAVERSRNWEAGISYPVS